MSNLPLEDQIACAERELALRRRVYPKWVDSGRMKPAKAEQEITAMEAIVATLNRNKILRDIGEEMQGKGGWQ